MHVQGWLKNKLQTVVHIFVKYRPIFKIRSPAHSMEKCKIP